MTSEEQVRDLIAQLPEDVSGLVTRLLALAPDQAKPATLERIHAALKEGKKRQVLLATNSLAIELEQKALEEASILRQNARKLSDLAIEAAHTAWTEFENEQDRAEASA